MTGPRDLERRNLELAQENQRLKSENDLLKSELEFLKTYPSIAQGIKGERLVANLTGGVLTGYSDPHDVIVHDEDRIEVKTSHVDVQKGTRTKRWGWSNILGRRNTKEYEWLVLIGEKDLESGCEYPVDLPFVFFMVPRDQVDLIKTGNMIAINTNLDTARAPKSVALKRHLVVSGTKFKDLFLNASAG